MIAVNVILDTTNATFFNLKSKFEAQRREPLPNSVPYSRPFQQYGPPKISFPGVSSGSSNSYHGGGGSSGGYYGGSIAGPSKFHSKKHIGSGGSGGYGYGGSSNSFLTFKGQSTAENRIAPKQTYEYQRYGVPQTPSFFQKKPIFPQKQFSAPRPIYGPPIKTQGCDGWTPIVGPQINHNHGPVHVPVSAPASGPTYEIVGHSAPSAEALSAPPPPPQVEFHAPEQSYGPPAEFHAPAQSYGPPAAIPIEVHSPDSSYGPPAAGLVQPPIIDEPHAPLDSDLHLPDVGPAGDFHNSLAAGFDIVKSEGIEVTLQTIPTPNYFIFPGLALPTR